MPQVKLTNTIVARAQPVNRSTGQPHEIHSIEYDIAERLAEIKFPNALPLAMSLARTFWEKASAAQMFCAQGSKDTRHMV